MKPLIYIAGPYSHPDPVMNVREAVLWAEALYLDDGVVPVVPHLSMLWHTISPHPVEFWYEYDLHVLARCDAVFRILGSSEGTDNEVLEAKRLGIPVFGPYVDERFREWIRHFELKPDEQANVTAP